MAGEFVPARKPILASVFAPGYRTGELLGFRAVDGR